jgi:hypothetical protein
LDKADERVELRRVACSLDLWSLIESAQYARIVLNDPPADQGEALAMASFMESLSAVIETWSEIAQSNAAPMLQDLDARLADLARGGLFVHGGCVERSVQIEQTIATPLPLAVIRIDHDGSEWVAVDIPAELDVALPEDEGRQDT